MTNKEETLVKYKIIRSYLNRDELWMHQHSVPFYYGVEDGRPFVLYAIKIEDKEPMEAGV